MRRALLVAAVSASALAMPLGMSAEPAHLGLGAFAPAGSPFVWLPPPAPDQASELPGLALAAPAYAAGLTETLLRVQIDFSQIDLGQRIALEHGPLPGAVLATSYWAPGSDGDGLLLRIDERGDTSYKALIDSGLPDVLYGVDIDAEGNALGGGYSYDHAQLRHLFLAAKVDAAGVLKWVRLVPIEAPNFYTFAYDLAVDSAGNAVLAGLDLRFDGGRFEYDAAVAKLDPAGNVVWARRVLLPGTLEYVTAVATDPRNDDILLAGATTAAGGYDALVMRLDKDGNLLARKAVDAGGPEFARGVAVDGEGNVLVAGYTAALGSTAAFLARLGPGLDVQWTQAIAAGQYTVATDVDVDGQGNAVLGGYAYSGLGGYDVFVAKVTPLGVTLFTRLIDGVEGGGLEFAAGVAASPDGLLVVTGGSALAPDGDYDLWFTKSLGLSGAGAVGGVANTALNAPGLL